MTMRMRWPKAVGGTVGIIVGLAVMLAPRGRHVQVHPGSCHNILDPPLGLVAALLSWSYASAIGGSWQMDLSKARPPSSPFVMRHLFVKVPDLGVKH